MPETSERQDNPVEQPSQRFAFWPNAESGFDMRDRCEACGVIKQSMFGEAPWCPRCR